MKVVVVEKIDLILEAVPAVVAVCTQEVARKNYGYSKNGNDSELYVFTELELEE